MDQNAAQDAINRAEDVMNREKQTCQESLASIEDVFRVQKQFGGEVAETSLMLHKLGNCAQGATAAKLKQVENDVLKMDMYFNTCIWKTTGARQ